MSSETLSLLASFGCSVWLTSLQINLNDTICFDEGIRAAEGTSIMGH